MTGADNRVQYDGGKPVMQWVSAKTRDAMGARRYFDNIVRAVQADVDTYNDKRTAWLQLSSQVIPWKLND